MAGRDSDDDAIEEGPPQPRRKRAPRAEGDDFEDDDRPRRRRPPQTDDGVSTVIPYRNGPALAGYYCGVFSLIPCLGLILGPIALVLGILGLRAVKRTPEAKGTAHAIVAIVLGGLVLLGHIGIIVVMVIAGIKGPR
jgi:hypothetical protein